jgi:hypothetical protein
MVPRSPASAMPWPGMTRRRCFSRRRRASRSTRPPNTAPWADAVTMVLEYAGIPYATVWDAEVLEGRLGDYDWLHLHHEDFTGQYSKFFLSFAATPWLREEVARNTEMATRFGYADVPELKRAVAEGIRSFVMEGGFLFAMCSATETLDLALASHGTDITAILCERTAPGPRRRRAHGLEPGPGLPGRPAGSASVNAFSDIDTHQVNTPRAGARVLRPLRVQRPCDPWRPCWCRTTRP